MKHIRKFNESVSNISKEEFIDEFLDRLYINGSKEDGKYILTLTQATQAANEIYNEFIKDNKDNKSNLKEEICNSLIEAYKPVFDAYPELNSIPVYATGRYYKYELVGEDFEVFHDQGGFNRFYQLLSGEKIQWDLLSKIDKEHNNKGGKLWIGEWGDYLPIKEEVIKAFNIEGGRGGKCLVIFKEGDNFNVKDITCDSPE